MMKYFPCFHSFLPSSHYLKQRTRKQCSKLCGKFQAIQTNFSGAGCSKLTSFLKVSLRLKNLNITNTLLSFVGKKCWKNERILDSHIFSTKNNSVFDNVVGIYLTSRLLLTTLLGS